ncbi:amine oxidase [Microbulbifer flavimaris]|uniref:Amine oxidase n=1 Tax=Microbulbifer flavimaris TaxID=1781068 RepID=A0ABX4HWX2_9GAMM|nr:amine oxidase [Microbulbifer sp. ZGT114]PCO04620.1 amine oxidase [Microbulbifer flavimaris]
MPPDLLDVVIIGAGISGLYAARQLRPQHRIAVLEARDRVGGRLCNHRFANGETVDIGGQWVGPGQDRMYRLISELGFETWPLWDSGDNLLWDSNRGRRYKGTIPRIGPLALLDLGQAMARFERMARSIDTAAPWAHPNASKWDRQTLASWLQRNCRTRRARKLFAIGIGAVFAAEPEELSLLHALFYARSGNSLETLLSVTGGAQQDRVHGGTAGLCTRMARELGDDLHLNASVSSIEREAEGTLRVYFHGGVLRCRRLIMALPPNQALRIQFSPALSARRDQLWQRMPAGSCIKCVARYDRPFWRDEGLSGQVTSVQGPVRVVFDNSEAGSESGLLMGFLEGEAARHYGGVDAEVRRRDVLDCFARYFGDQARRPLEYVDRDWSSEPWTRGCYAALMPPGVWTQYGQVLRDADGPIHYAGTESATEWYGYMEGALQAAERAVGEVREALSQNAVELPSLSRQQWEAPRV